MSNIQSSIKKCLPDVLAVLLFAVLAFAYFFPADIEGRILYEDCLTFDEFPAWLAAQDIEINGKS